MKKIPFWMCACILGLVPLTQAAVLTVTTADNANPPAGQLSFAQALSQLKEGDEIRFNIPGAGPHYLVTPATGYPIVTQHNVRIDGYSQPGAIPNSNPILAANNAQIKIFLDSRQSGRTVLDYDGYGLSESAVLGVVGASNVTIRGLGFLARVASNTEADPSIYCISFAAKATGGHVSGCWLGVDANGRDVFGANAAITGFRFREETQPFLSDNITVGVSKGAINAPSEFNVIAGMIIPIIIEGAHLRVAGNFIGVLPNGLTDYNPAFSDKENERSEGAIQVGRHGGGTLIGTDGDGTNDPNERNIFGGVVPRTVDPQGYFRMIEFYGGGPRTNIVVAGNYFGVAIDGQSRFTNGVPILSGQTATTRIGSDFDGVSDAVEGNLIFNNFPASLFTEDTMARDFLEGVGADAVISLRGNKLVNNFIPPVSPLREGGAFVTNYYSKALLNLDNGIVPVLSTNSSIARLIGTVPLADTNFYPVTMVDLYIPDPEGLARRIPELPNGMIQGLTYLGSFVEGSSTDLNPNPGEFSFDISRLNIPKGTQLTATANFSQEPSGTHNAPVLTTLFSDVNTAGEPVFTDATITITRDANSVTLNWNSPGFTLQSAPSVTGPWTNEPSTGTSFTTPITGVTKFFRLVR